ncbi:hypothetical protein MMC25_004473 [Agyrium rufum]|nr:hypothetical protein [Agyrium rufum]
MHNFHIVLAFLSFATAIPQLAARSDSIVVCQAATKPYKVTDLTVFTASDKKASDSTVSFKVRDPTGKLSTTCSASLAAAAGGAVEQPCTSPNVTFNYPVRGYINADILISDQYLCNETVQNLTPGIYHVYAAGWGNITNSKTCHHSEAGKSCVFEGTVDVPVLTSQAIPTFPITH